MHPIATPTPTVIYLASAPDWTTQTVAIATIVLTLATIVLAYFTYRLVTGVKIATDQFEQDGHFNRAVQTTNLLADWNELTLRSFRRDLEHGPDYEINRDWAEQIYVRLALAKDKDKWTAFIEDTAALAERIKLFLDKNLADKSIIYTALAYDIISTYYYLQNILQERTYKDDMLYDSFRDLTIMAQTYAKKHHIDIRPQLLDAVFPELTSKLDEGDNRSKGLVL